jgi:hypothetical protein
MLNSEDEHVKNYAIKNISGITRMMLEKNYDISKSIDASKSKFKQKTVNTAKYFKYDTITKYSHLLSKLN